MLERQDIDALLIGSLYGELSSTEEARLSAHLESHPADRTALADLTRARTIVRESRILQVEFDPPQSITALLMQEAVRRAPKAADAPSWFQRFVKSFMLHPAMAAAAMLVLIIGVASTMYSRKGDQYAAQTKDEAKPAGLSFETAPAAGEPDRNEAEGQKLDETTLKQEFQANPADGAGLARDNFAVSLDDGVAGGGEDDADGQPREDAVQTNLRGGAVKEREQTGFKGKSSTTTQAPPKVAAKQPARTILEVTTDDKAPKDLGATLNKPATIATNKPEPRPASAEKPRAGTGGAANVRGPVADKPTEPGGATVDRRTTSDRSRSPDSESAQPMAPPPPPAQIAHEEKLRVDTELAWAKDQHAKAIAQVKAGNCTNAANIALAISNRAPSYYAQNVESDRTLKPCNSYITAQREKQAERIQRQKAQRRTVDEPAKAAPNPTTTTK